MNRYYPLMIDLTDRSCLVIGGGEVAARKIESLLESGARVVVISPQAVPLIVDWAERGMLDWRKETYVDQDVSGYTLVIAATNQPAVNLVAHQAVMKQGGWINIADRPDLCNFTMPSTVQRGKLLISVSTSGASPGLARKIRQAIEQEYGPAYEEYVEFLAEIRHKVLGQVKEPARRKEIFRLLLDDSFLKASKEERYSKVEALLVHVEGRFTSP